VSQAPLSANIVFPDGLVGMPSLVRHHISAVPGSALYELVSDDDPSMGFIAASGEHVKPGMAAALVDRGLAVAGEWVLVILAVHGDPPQITANLAGPLVIDMEKATARQVVIEDPDFPLQAPLPKES